MWNLCCLWNQNCKIHTFEAWEIVDLLRKTINRRWVRVILVFRNEIIPLSSRIYYYSLTINSTIDWSQAQYEKGGGLLSGGRAFELKSEPN